MISDLKITHNSGFFSCCSVALQDICKYYNNRSHFPVVDRSEQFYWYKEFQNQDLSSIIFSEKEKPIVDSKIINFDWLTQFTPYRKLDFAALTPLVNSYFSPSNLILDRLEQLKKDVGQNPENIISVCYRGNDKFTETMVAPYSTFIKPLDTIVQKYDNPLFYLQTDEIEFADFFTKKYPNTFINNKIPLIKRNLGVAIQHVIPMFSKEKFEFSCDFLASLLFMSQTDSVVTHSGNVGVWLALYRGHVNNLYQYLNGSWV